MKGLFPHELLQVPCLQIECAGDCGVEVVTRKSTPGETLEPHQ
jgi:hypothetical protein